MLDRVINAVYDGAQGGKFQAQHSMAEWMGCPIADLYGVLEAMGHKRIETPVVEKAAEDVAHVAEVVTEAPAEVTEVKAEEGAVTTEVVAEKKEPQKKPELDFFFLRRGKAHKDAAERRPHREKSDKPQFPKERYAPKNAKKSDSEGEHKKFKKKKFDSSKDGRKKDKREFRDEPRVYKAEANDHDNPFAVLQNLKLK